MSNNKPVESALPYNELLSAYDAVDEVIEKGYLDNIEKYEIVPVGDSEIDIVESIRFYQITKIVFDDDEDILDKLTTVYNTVHSLGGDIAITIHSSKEKVEFFLGVKQQSADKITNIADGFRQSFDGNFPGCTINKMYNDSARDLLENKIFTQKAKAVSMANGIPNLKSDDKEKFTQGLEKFIEAMQGKEYTALLIANAISSKDINQRRTAFENIYSSLLPFSSHEINFGLNESEAVTQGISESFTHTVNESLSKTTSHTEGTNSSEGTSRTHTGGVFMGGMIPPFVMGGANYSYSRGKTTNKGKSESDTTGETKNRGTAESETQSENSSDTKTKGTSENYQIKYENKTVKNILEKIDIQIKRIEASEDYGMYDFAAYFISSDYDTSRVAASAYKAVMRGDESSVEKSSITSWTIDISENKIIPYLKRLEHPIMALNNTLSITPTTLISSKELALAMNLPRKSVKGVVVTKSVEFARDIYLLEEREKNRSISLGSMYHLGRADTESKISIDINSLGMHTLITGSTGSGKSNTIYKMLDGLIERDIKFLVIEPAKGEYKEVFGGRKDVDVFGSNPKYTELLTINPFEFCDEIHVLEHIDRLIEIFNACWPMYAAMPAVLKDATIRSYVACGWDIDSSVCIGARSYPTFDILLSMLEEVIDISQYSDEMKSNYKGALITRVKSLTVGLSGQMMNQADSISEEALFDSNVIVDISRIGSMETKSLVMGILMLKLMEYRSAKQKGSNSALKHVTVLEEAHHLLKRTSTEQSGESANLQGKAVEMLSNAIAEMRTYGEGFIIADQSPNMLDISAIRNTGTKIIMRLPEFADRDDIGKSAALNEKQIDEIPKLATGVAVVYQNNWLEAILCKIDKFDKFKAYDFKSDLDLKYTENKKILGTILKILFIERIDDISQDELDAIDYDAYTKWLSERNISESSKMKLSQAIIDYREKKISKLQKEDNFSELSKVVFELLDGDKILSLAKSAENLNEYNSHLTRIIGHYVDTQNNEMFETAIKQAILSNEAKETNDFKELYFSWVEEQRTDSGGVV